MKEIAHSPTLADVVRVTGRWLTGRKDKLDNDPTSDIDDLDEVLDIDDTNKTTPAPIINSTTQQHKSPSWKSGAFVIKISLEHSSSISCSMETAH